jgi:hypothetical protein
MYAWLPVGATALGESSPPLQPVSTVIRFLNKIIIYRMGFLAPCPTPILYVHIHTTDTHIVTNLVIIDRFLIDDRIYWTLYYSA